MRYLIASLFALMVVSSASADPPITEPPSRNRLAGYFIGSFGGELKVRGNGLRASGDGDPGFGIGLRYELLLGESFSLLPTFEWLSFDVEDGLDRSHVVDFDVALKFRKKVRAGRVTLEFYGLSPFGFSVGSSDAFDDAAVGFNTGFVGGAMVFFKRKYGVFLEGGWRIHVLFDDGYRGILNQGVLHAGGAIAF